MNFLWFLKNRNPKSPMKSGSQQSPHRGLALMSTLMLMVLLSLRARDAGFIVGDIALLPAG
jgi:hypothetical protein